MFQVVFCHSTFSPDECDNYYNNPSTRPDLFAKSPDQHITFCGKLLDRILVKWFCEIAHKYHWFAVTSLLFLYAQYRLEPYKADNRADQLAHSAFKFRTKRSSLYAHFEPPGFTRTSYLFFISISLVRISGGSITLASKAFKRDLKL